ncbi:MAG TPA: PDZ domain-containing protein [Gemmatimonadaceae bacterium]|nr:PDZ domain-containing protein [Gemmatimonadaceae bacterium]
MTRNRLGLIGLTLLTGAFFAPVGAAAQEGKCSPCEAEDRDRAVRRYQQEIERVRREIAMIERQLDSSRSALDSAKMRRLNERMQRAIEQLSRAHARQAAQLQVFAGRARSPIVATVPPANQWLNQAMDGYIGVLWSANVNVETPKHGDALWTFHDYPHVEAVERASPAERAGIQVGDMILAFDGKDLRAGKIPMNTLLRPGNTVTVRLNRENRTRSVSVTVEPRPQVAVRGRTPRPNATVLRPGTIVIEPPEPGDVSPTPPTAATPTIAPLPPLGVFGGAGPATATAGADMIVLDETLGEPYGTDYGLLIIRVGPRTPAARAGLLKGDVLLSADGRELRSATTLIRAVERAEDGQVRLELLRKRERKVVVLQW